METGSERGRDGTSRLRRSQRREQNSRSWSQESQGATLPRLREPDSASVNQRCTCVARHQASTTYQHWMALLESSARGEACYSTYEVLPDIRPNPSPHRLWTLVAVICSNGKIGAAISNTLGTKHLTRLARLVLARFVLGFVLASHVTKLRPHIACGRSSPSFARTARLAQQYP
jgi:hypothetical protein